MKKKIKTLLCGVAKMENNYIEEWVRYYEKLGFDKIVLFDNNATEGEKLTDVPYVKEKIDCGYIDLINQYDKMGLQTAQYTECYNLYGEKYDWLAFFDIDEYLMFKDFQNVNDFLSQEKFNNFDLIHVQWKLYDDNGMIYVENSDYSLLNRFTHPLDVVNLLDDTINKRNIYYGYFYHKSIIKGGIRKALRFCGGNSHTIDMEKSDRTLTACNVNGTKVKTFEMAHKYLEDSDAWLNHYICKTLEEYVTNKLVRLCGSTSSIESERFRVNLGLFLKYNLMTFDKLKYMHDAMPEECDKLLRTMTTCCARYMPELMKE